MVYWYTQVLNFNPFRSTVTFWGLPFTQIFFTLSDCFRDIERALIYGPRRRTTHGIKSANIGRSKIKCVTPNCKSILYRVVFKGVCRFHYASHMYIICSDCKMVTRLVQKGSMTTTIKMVVEINDLMHINISLIWHVSQLSSILSYLIFSTIISLSLSLSLSLSALAMRIFFLLFVSFFSITLFFCDYYRVM